MYGNIIFKSLVFLKLLEKVRCVHAFKNSNSKEGYAVENKSSSYHSCSLPFSFPGGAALNSFLCIIPNILYVYKSMLIFVPPSIETQNLFKHSGSIFYTLPLHLTLAVIPYHSFQWLCGIPLYACIISVFLTSPKSVDIQMDSYLLLLQTVPQWVFPCGHYRTHISLACAVIRAHCIWWAGRGISSCLKIFWDYVLQ